MLTPQVEPLPYYFNQIYSLLFRLESDQRKFSCSPVTTTRAAQKKNSRRYVIAGGKKLPLSFLLADSDPGSRLFDFFTILEVRNDFLD